MAQVTTKVQDDILKAFRDVIYTRFGLKKGDVKHALEEAMIDYIEKYREKPS